MSRHLNPSRAVVPGFHSEKLSPGRIRETVYRELVLLHHSSGVPKSVLQSPCSSLSGEAGLVSKL